MKTFWNSNITEASWQGLEVLSKEIDFVLIGGWATYLYIKLQKSKDIDIIIDYSTLRYLQSNYTLVKNERLSKYEIKGEKFDIDIYLPNYSKLTIPPKDISSKFASKVEGFVVPVPEALMALKLGAFADRRESIKGAKDAVDILGLLFYSGLDTKFLNKILLEYGIRDLMDLLRKTLQNFDKRDIGYLNLNESSFSKLRHKYIDELKKA